MPSTRARASSISTSVGPSSVFNLEHLLHDLANRRQRVELSALDLVEKPAQLGIVADRALEMRFGARGCDREDLPREVLAPPLVEPAVADQELAVPLNLLPDPRHVLAAHRFGEDDRRLPLTFLIEREDRPHLVQHRLRS